MKELLDAVNGKLFKKNIPASVLLSKFNTLYAESNMPIVYSDPAYFPFYYYLGSELKTKNLLDMSFDAGLTSGSFLIGCKTVENVLAFQRSNEEYSFRFGRRNVKRVYRGNIDFYSGKELDPSFLEKISSHRWDLVILNEYRKYDEYMACLRFIWKYIDSDGLLIMDNINYFKSASDAYLDFCKANSKEPAIFNSKYFAGVIQK